MAKTHLLRKVYKLSDGECTVEECVIGVGDDNGNGIGVSRCEVPGNHVARILNPVRRVVFALSQGFSGSF